jgi:serine/threonine protein kinase/predicted Zn-dependent protease
MNGQARAPSWGEIDPFIAAFESAWARGGEVSLSDHLPDPAHPHFGAILCELVRVDLEFGWSAGRPRPLALYLDAYPMLAASAEYRSEVAFEEYRLRQQAGESPTPEDYANRFAVDTANWPAPRAPGQPGSTVNSRAEDKLESTVIVPGGAGPAPAPSGAGGVGAETGSDLAERLGQVLSALADPHVEVPGFRLLRELGSGAFGRVYLARQEDLANRDVVLKLSGDLRGEPQTLARLQHTNIVPIYSVHRVGPLHAFCMPYFGAVTFATLIRALRDRSAVPTSGAWLTEQLPDAPNRPLRVRSELESRSYVGAVLWLGARLAEGLAHAHEQGIVHRDLKPANVLLSDDGEPMLLDFNLARDPALAQQAPVEYIGGTLPYMSPERLAAFAAGRQHVDPRDDVYALGLILYELLTGRAAVQVTSGRAVADIVRQLTEAHRRPIPDTRTANQAVTPAVAAILARCVARDPARRYRSAHELAEDITRHLADRPLVHAPNTSVRERFTKWRRRHPRLSSVSTSVAVAVVLLGAAVGAAAHKNRELRRSEAVNNLREFRDELSASRLLIRSPAPSRQDVARGLEVARHAADRYGLTDRSDPDQVLAAPQLDPATTESLREELAELATLLSRGEEFQARLTPEGSARVERFELAVRYSELSERLTRDGDQVILCRRHRADLLLGLGRVDEARALREGAAPTPQTTKHLRTLAGERMARGEYAAAVGLLKRANRADPQNPLGLMLLGYCYERQRLFPRAVGCYDAVLALVPGSNLAHYRRAAALAQCGEHTEALEDFSAVLTEQPDDLPARVDRARSYAALGDYRAARADLDRALETPSAPTELYFLRARYRAALGDRAGAIADKKEGLAREPNDERSWLARGAARVATDPRAALADFDRALQLNPGSLVAHENRAAVLSENLNRQKDALRALDTALEIDPHFVPALLGRAVLRARAGLRTEAHRDVQAALKLTTAPADHYQAACVFALTSAAEEKDLPDALFLLESALRGGYSSQELVGDHDLDPIRNVRGFQELLKRFGPTPKAKRD